MGVIDKILQSPETTIAVVAVLISLFSLILSIVTAFQNRKNNRLGVRPIAYVLPPDYENRIAVIIQNKGTGPLISRKISFHKGNNEQKGSLIDFMPPLYEGYYWKTFSEASKIILSPLEEIILLEFSGDPEDSKFVEQRDLVRKELSSLEIRLQYTSIFNERKAFELNYRLKWFARNK